ncbi:MAG: phenylalanine--tRNA ligase subunit beta [Bdellovibrionales bacterium]|nr:phenylalanine--tRNA ligase subunit beta [Bdellovibrionales bacterium]
MKISFNWLSEYIDLDNFKSNSNELGKKLTDVGLEVEGIEDQKKAWENVVVAKIITKKAHPNADRLSLCQVKVGAETLQIVCGAKNHKEGDWVVAALPGANLPGDFLIKKSKLRGELSCGMLCSEEELGLNKTMDGILILQKEDLKKEESLQEGKNWSDYKNLSDSIFDINITPNRTDCLSHFGIARELSCVLDKTLKKDFPAKTISDKFSAFPIKIEKSNLNLGYSGCVVKNVKIKESPKWLKQRLASVGVKSINNVVDVTNFVMWELGQPMHAFDLQKVNKEINIRKAKKGESLVTLDNKNIEFKGGELIIANESSPIALAGIIGGLDSGVNKDTQDIFIESAYFSPSDIRKTAKVFGIQTDSSDRFSKGSDSSILLQALNRACELIKDLAQAEVEKDIFYHKPPQINNEKINITQKFLEDKLGYSVNMKDFDKWIKALGCQLKVSSSESREVVAPIFRKDLCQPVDLLEEYARLNGYDKIPEVLPSFTGGPGKHNDYYLQNTRLANLCKNAGLLQAINYHFTNSIFQKEFLEFDLLHKTKDLKKYSTYMGGDPVSVLNPLSGDLNVMRLSLLPGLFQNLIHNYNHNQKLGNLFELGTVFNKQENNYNEQNFLSLISWGNKETLWDKSKSPLVFELKGRVESLLKSLNISFKWKVIKDLNLCPDFLHPKRSLALQIRGKLVGYLGDLHPMLLQKHKIRLNVSLAEFNTDLFNLAPTICDSNILTGKYPSVTRDLSVLCLKTLLSEDINQLIKKVAGKDCISCRVFDIYEPKDKEKLSITFRLVVQNSEKTYSEEDLQLLQANIFKNLSDKLGVEIPSS